MIKKLNPHLIATVENTKSEYYGETVYLTEELTTGVDKWYFACNLGSDSVLDFKSVWFNVKELEFDEN